MIGDANYSGKLHIHDHQVSVPLSALKAREVVWLYSLRNVICVLDSRKGNVSWLALGVEWKIERGLWIIICHALVTMMK